MNESTTTLQPVRRLPGAIAVFGATTAAWWAGGHYLLGLLPARGIDALTTVAVVAVGMAVLTWYVLTAAVTVACLSLRTAGVVWCRGEQAVRRSGAPALRRILGGGAGAMLVAGSVLGPAYAEDQQDDVAQVSLTWAPAPDPAEPGTGTEHRSDDGHDGDADEPGDQAPDLAERSPHHAPTDDGAPPESTGTTQTTRTTEDVPTEGAEPGSSPAGADPATGQVHVVQPGETLWSIAAETLPEPVDDAAIAQQWPRWYESNAEVIGADPDLIIPGQELLAPPRSTS